MYKYLVVLVVCLFSAVSFAEKRPVISGVEVVSIMTSSGPVDISARIDTGAGMSSIAESLYEEYDFQVDRSPTENTKCPNGQAYIRSANGNSCRLRVKIKFILGGRLIENTVTVADRSALSHKLLIGRRDLVGFNIQISDYLEDLDEED